MFSLRDGYTRTVALVSSHAIVEMSSCDRSRGGSQCPLVEEEGECCPVHIPEAHIHKTPFHFVLSPGEGHGLHVLRGEHPHQQLLCSSHGPAWGCCSQLLRSHVLRPEGRVPRRLGADHELLCRRRCAPAPSAWGCGGEVGWLRLDRGTSCPFLPTCPVPTSLRLGWTGEGT